jgi:hypothetical protein
MPRPLIIAGSMMLCLVALSSMVFNYQSADFRLKDTRDNNIPLSENQKIGWKAILLEASQYQPTTKGSNQTIDKSETEISDSTVVGIILDEPNLVLLLIEGTNEIVPIKIGEGWLNNWVIKSIKADTVSWLNTQNQQQYVQRLFDLTISETTTNKKINKKRNGKRK